MNIRAKRKILQASDSHFSNLDDLLMDESDVSLLNHQMPADLLIDPMDVPEDLHSVQASVKRRAKKRVRADLEEDDNFDDNLIDMPEDGIAGDEVDADDYLDDPMEEDDDRVSPDAILLLSEDENDDNPIPDVDEDEKHDPEDAHKATQEDDNNHTERQRPDDEDDDEEVKADDVSLQNSQNGKQDLELITTSKGKKAVKSCGDLATDPDMSYNVVDLDGIPDDVDGDDLVFASVDKTKLVLHSNRVIATMDEDDAVASDVDDVYMDDEFDEAVSSEVCSKGLRAGLRSTGFKLATVKIKASTQVKASVAKQTATFKKNAIAAQERKQGVMNQCFAIASVGLNRNMFKDYENSLRTELVSQFESLGVRHASKVVKAAFEKYGVDYAKKIVAIASDISDLPEETRDGLASQLDMTNEPDMEDEDILSSPNLYGDPVSGEEEDVEEDDFDEDVSTVESALRHPLKANFSKSDREINKPLPFIHY